MIDVDDYYKESKGQDALDEWFGLSYSSFLTMPRLFMNTMPDQWKLKMAELLCEYDEKINQSEVEVDGMRVMAIKNGKITKMPNWIINYRHPDTDIIKKLRQQ